MDSTGRWKWLDAVASIVIGIILLVVTAWTTIELITLPRQMELFAELGAVELPTFTQLIWKATSFKVFHGLALLVFLGGVACLFAVKDRLRANVYCLAAILLLAALAGVVRLAWWLPLTRVISEVSQ